MSFGKSPPIPKAPKPRPMPIPAQASNPTPTASTPATQQSNAMAAFSFAPRLAAFGERKGGRRSMIGGG